MGRFFQDLDFPHFDYRLAGCDQLQGWEFRGPVPDLGKPYFVCVGAAQMFGRFCKDPIPDLLSQAIGLPVLNLGISGSGPSMFLEPSFLEVINGAQFAVVQVMSGRSESNSEFDNSASGGARGLRLSDGKKMLFDEFLAEKLAQSGRDDVVRIIEETRQNWVRHYRELLSAIRVPTVLHWFSTITPRRSDDYASWWKLLGAFPQLVNRRMIDQIIPFADTYVQTVRNIGLPQALWPASSAIDGTELYNGTLLNNYYPSPEMHEAGFRDLLGVCKALAPRERPQEEAGEPRVIVASANRLDGLVIADLCGPGTLVLSYDELLEDRGLLPFLAAGQPRFIHVRRRNLLEGYTADRSAFRPPSEGNAVYVDPVAYAGYVLAVATAERRIARSFGAANSLEVFVEDLVADPRPAASHIASFLHKPAMDEGSAAIAIARLRPARAAENTEELRSLFARALGDLPRNNE